MLANITEEEIEFCECLYDPLCLIECLFSDLDNLSLFNEKFSHIRLYQLPMLSYEYMIDYDDLSKEEQLKLREKAGTTYAFAARTIGKTLITEKVDILLSMLLLDNDIEGFTSFDVLHIRGVLEDIITAIENHPILKVFIDRINRSPNYQLRAKNGWFLESVNMNISSKRTAGKAFHQKHFSKLFIEEASYETEEVYKKRAESTQEGGHQVIRASGMTNFTKYTPAGRIFYDIKNKPFIVNLPAYVSPSFTEETKKEAIKRHSGEHTASFKIFVEGEVIEHGFSVFDMQRVRENYLEDKKIKHFEIDKKTFEHFEDIIIIERAKNAEEVYIAADIGETSATEIIVLFKINDKYRYEYNITLYNLTDKEQKEIFDYLIQKLQANVIAIDCGEGLGRVIYRYLEEKYGKEHLVYYDGSKKIKVGFERDENNNIVFKNGEPVYKEEYMSEWSVQRLKTLLYENKLLIPIDYKFDKQFNSIICTQSGNRTIYESTAEEDHLYDAFRIFAIAQWDKEFASVKPVKTKRWCKTGV